MVRVAAFLAAAAFLAFWMTLLASAVHALPEDGGAGGSTVEAMLATPAR